MVWAPYYAETRARTFPSKKDLATSPSSTSIKFPGDDGTRPQFSRVWEISIAVMEAVFVILFALASAASEPNGNSFSTFDFLWCRPFQCLYWTWYPSILRPINILVIKILGSVDQSRFATFLPPSLETIIDRPSRSTSFYYLLDHSPCAPYL